MQLNDYPDSFSPILVKDLRRLLKSQVFIRSFLFLHVFLLLLAVGSFFDWYSEGVALIFWCLVFLLCIGTLRECNFNKSEDTGKNMELIRVSGVSSAQLIVGKWCAVNILLILYITSTLPYLVFRYFSGSIEIVFELIILLSFGALFSMIASIQLGVSSSPSLAARLLFVVTLVVGAIFGINVFIDEVLTNPVASTWPDLLAVVLLVIFLIVYPLQVGIANLEEGFVNHAARKRILVLGTCALVLALSFVNNQIEMGSMVIAMVTAIGVFDAITESLPRLEIVLKPFSKSLLKRHFANLLISGWPSAYLLFLLCTGLWLAQNRFSEQAFTRLTFFLFFIGFFVNPIFLSFWLADKINLSPQIVWLICFAAMVLIYWEHLPETFEGNKLLLSMSWLNIGIVIIAPVILGFRWYRKVNSTLRLLSDKSRSS